MITLFYKAGGQVLILKEGIFVLLVVCSFIGICIGDTFTGFENGQVLHGYIIKRTEDDRAIVQTTELGRIELNLVQWQVEFDYKGRNNKVVVFDIEGPIEYEIETAAFEQALPIAASTGPFFILLEINTPGGRVDLARRICGAITAMDDCKVVCYVKSGSAGGALSAGAAVALACDELYMAADTSIGAATMITADAQTLSSAFGAEVGEKFDSAWRAFFASLAEQNGRPGLLARAMVDDDIEVVEVLQGDSRLFIEPINVRANQRVLRTWSTKGSLLTLTAAEAAQCSIANGVVQSRAELLRQLGAQDAKIILDKAIERARRELERAKGQLARIRRSVDLKIKKAQGPMSRPEALKLLREARSEFKNLVNLARKYPDLGLDVVALENELNSIEATYQQMKRQPRYR